MNPGSAKKRNFSLKGILLLIGIPLAVAAVMELICRLFFNTDLMNLKKGLDISNFFRDAGIGACAAFALSFNVPSGRMDLSLGAQQMTATIIGGCIAVDLGLGTAGILVFAVLSGLVVGSLVGLIFVTLRIPAMVLGIGMGLIYECVTFTVYPEGLSLAGLKNVELLKGHTEFEILVVIVAAVLVIVMLQFTKFGYHKRAIQSSQRIARNSGVNVFKNAFICYLVAGALMALSGVFTVGFKSSMAVDLGTTSNGTIFIYMFPMLLGAFISRWSNQTLGIISGVLANQFFTIGLMSMHLSIAATGLANMLLFLAFLIFRDNFSVLHDRRQKAKRIQEAKAKRVAMAIPASA